MKIKIGKCKVRHKYDRDIEDHPYYISLKNASEEEYMSVIRNSQTQSNKETGTWEGFNRLVESIRQNGYDPSYAPIIFRKNTNGEPVCIHGRHRLCIMRYLYGKKLKIKISDGYLVKIKKKKI